MSLPLALLCGGLATRLHPVTKTLPKSMIEVAGEPFIAHQLRLFKKNHIEKIILCCGYLSEQIEAFVGDGSNFGLNVAYSTDGEKLLGTGGALKKALPMLGDDFMVAYGDSYLNIDYQAVAAAYKNASCKALMTVFKNNGQWDTSNVVFENGRIARYDKRPQQRDPARNYAYIDYGLGIFTAAVFKAWPAEAFDLADVYRKQVDEQAICGYEVFTRFYEIGSEKGIVETDQFLKARHG